MRPISGALLVAFLVTSAIGCRSREVRLPDPPPSAPSAGAEAAAAERTSVERSDTDGWWRVTRSDFTGQRAFTEIVVFDPHAGALWPGAVVTTRALSSGRIDPVALPRSGGTVTIPRYRMESAIAGPSRHLPAPGPDAYRGAYLDLTGAAGAQPGAPRAEVTTLHDPGQACARIGLHSGWLPEEVMKALDAAAESGKRTLLAVGVGRTVTVVFLPDDPGRWFAKGVTPEQVVRAAGQDDPLAYVRSVTYGRAVLVLAETEVEESALDAALEFFLAGPTALGAKAANGHRKVLDEGSYSVFEYGPGRAGAAVRAEDASALVGTLSRTSVAPSGGGAVPVSFETRYLDGSACAQAHATDWTETRSTPPAPYRAAIRLHSLEIEDTCESALDAAGDFVVDIRMDGADKASWNRARGSSDTIAHFGRGKHAVEQTVLIVESDRRFIDLEIRFGELDRGAVQDPNGIEVLALEHVDLAPDEPVPGGNADIRRPSGFIRDLSVVRKNAGGRAGMSNTASLSLIRLDPE